MPNPTFRQLDIFAAVVRSGSIAVSARALELETSDVAQTVRDLEAQLGHRLLEASDNGLVLTGAGKRMVEALRLLEQSLKADRAPEPTRKSSDAAAPRRRPAATAPKPSFRLVLATHPTLFSHFRDALAEYESDHPDAAIDLDLDRFTADRVATGIADQSIDIAYYYALEGEPGPRSDYVWTERLSLFVGDRHPLARQDLVRTADLALVPPILLAPGNPLRRLTDALMDQAGLGAAPPALETDDYGRLFEAVRAGYGFLPLFGGLAQQAGGLDGVTRLPFADPLPAPQVRRALGPAIADHPLAIDLISRLS